MASSFINRLSVALKNIENIIGYFKSRGFPPGALCTVDLPHFDNKQLKQNTKLFDLEKLKDGIFFAVPTHRRTIEKRRKRKFGWPKYVWKPFVPRTDILMCLNCGHNHLANSLCPNCYDRVKQETLKMQEEIEKDLGLEPVEKEVVVLYEGEEKSNFWHNHRVIQLARKRPYWFNSNLLQSSSEKEDKEKYKIKSIEGKINNS